MAGASRRLKAYLAAVAASSCVFAAELTLSELHLGHYPSKFGGVDLLFLLQANALLLAATIFATSVLMFAPWLAVICIGCKMRWSGPRFFAASGSTSAVTVGCAASFLMPKPLFIEDRTFLKELIIFAERLGPMLFVAGLIGGLTYWLVAERRAVT